MPSVAAVDWFGSAPVEWHGDPDRSFSMALWRIDRAEPESARTAPIDDAHLVCVHLSGRMDWACETATRSYRRPGLPNTFCIARAGESADFEMRNARVEFAHFYLPTRWLEEQAGDTNSDGTGRRIELIDPMNSLSLAIGSLAARAVSWVRAGGPAARLEVEATVLRLAATLIRDHSNYTPLRPHRGGLAVAKKRRVVDALEECMTRDVGLAELAVITGLSEQHFCRAFRESMGVTPHRYQTRVRIAKAQNLLRENRLTIAEIGAAVGYFDQAYFSRAFKREVGVTPSEWRRLS